MKLTQVSSDGLITRLSCEGIISRIGSSTCTNPLEEILGLGCYANKVLINLEKAESIDSTGVGWLVRSHKNFQDGGGKMVLHSVPPLVHHVFRLLNVDTYLNIAEDEKSGLALLLGNH